MWRHACRGIEEPRAQLQRGPLGESHVAGVPPGQRQRLHIVTHRGQTRLIEITLALGIGLPIATDVWQAVGLGRIGPPIRTQTVVVVRIVAGRDLRALVGHRNERSLERLLRITSQPIHRGLQCRVATTYAIAQCNERVTSQHECAWRR